MQQTPNRMNMGRKGIDQRIKHSCKTVSVSPENYEKIKQIGNGNFSEGVRRCLAIAENKNGN
jgi:hypothetical protein